LTAEQLKKVRYQAPPPPETHQGRQRALYGEADHKLKIFKRRKGQSVARIDIFIASSDCQGSVIREIIYYQHKNNERMLLVPKAAMSRVVKQIVCELGLPAGINRVTGECYALLHELAEIHVVAWFQMW
jgi:hypothetical protein